MVSYFCQENADDSALIDVVTIVQRPGLRGVMSWDTQKYENGENPNPPDGDCRTPDGASTPMTLSFTVDVTAATPKCGVRVVRIMNRTDINTKCRFRPDAAAKNKSTACGCQRSAVAAFSKF